jgi:hypothetical protein
MQLALGDPENHGYYGYYECGEAVSLPLRGHPFSRPDTVRDNSEVPPISETVEEPRYTGKVYQKEDESRSFLDKLFGRK